MTEILGSTGQIGSGKTAVAGRLHAVVGHENVGHVEFSDSVLALADAWMGQIGPVAAIGATELGQLRSAAARLYDINISREQAGKLAVADLSGYLAVRSSLAAPERSVVLANKERHRPLLQWLGYQMLAQVDERFWSRTVEARANAERDAGKMLVTIGGVRHPDDAATVHRLDGYVVEVVRPGAQHIYQTHASEGGLPGNAVDIRLHNGGDLDDLHGKAERLWADLLAGELAPEY